jgi:hypothetical protein
MFVAGINAMIVQTEPKDWAGKLELPDSAKNHVRNCIRTSGLGASKNLFAVLSRA